MKNKFSKIKMLLFLLVSFYLLFLLWNNVDFSKKMHYSFYSNITIFNDTLIYNTSIIDSAKPIFLPRGQNAILLLHGMGGTPLELKELAYYLAEYNITVFVPLMDYQGRDYGDLASYDGKIVYNKTLFYLDILQKYYTEVFIGGLSTGGLLSLKLAENRKVSGVLSYSSSIAYGSDFLDKISFGTFKILSYITPSLRRIEYGLARNQSIADFLPSFDRLPVHILLEGEKLKKEVNANLSRIDEPILILQSTWDNRATPSSAKYIYDRVSSLNKSLVYLYKSGHVITMDYDKNRVFELSRDFIFNFGK
jgi:carboxylesterase